MNRREFCQHMALLAAGTAALPAQIEAFERLYDVNTRRIGETGLVALRDFSFGFEGEPYDIAYQVELYEKERLLLALAINRRATFRWVAAADSPMLAHGPDVRWQVNSFGWRQVDERDPAEDLYGFIVYTDQEGVLHTDRMTGATGRLAL